MRRMRLIAALLLACSLLAYGCGGGGGGGSTSGTTVPSTTLSNNVSAKSFIAKNVAGNFATLNTENSKLSLRVGLRAEIKIEDLDSSTIKVSYGPADSVTSSLGVNYTYTGGYQIVRAKDQYGNPAMSAATTNTIEISSHNLACNYRDDGNFLSVAGNGKLVLTGFLSDTTFTVAAEGLNVNGTINGSDNFSLIIDDGSLTVTKTSFPYPRSGESESGKIIFNGAQYSYNISYDGTQTSQCKISGAESFGFKVNLANGQIEQSADTPQSPSTEGDPTGTNTETDSDSDSNTPPDGEQSAPTITSVTPNSDNVGARATITGQGFGQTQGAITIGGTIAQITSWSENSIQFRVPQVSNSGDQTLTLTASGKQVNSTFNVAAPAASNYSPSPIGKDQTLTISGNYFGAADDQVARTLYIKDHGYVSNVTWSDTNMSFLWPVNNTIGNKTVQLTISVGGLTQSFDVTAD